MLEMSTEVSSLKSKREKNSANIAGSFNKAEYNYPTMEKEILAVIRGIEKFLNLFLFELIAKEYLVL